MCCLCVDADQDRNKSGGRGGDVWAGGGLGWGECNPLDEMNINAVRTECCWSRAFWYIATRTIGALNKTNGMGGALTMWVFVVIMYHSDEASLPVCSHYASFL